MIRSTRKLKVLILASGDLLAAYLALGMTLIIRYGGGDFAGDWKRHAGPFTLIFILWLVIFFIVGLYDYEDLRSRIELMAKTGEALLAAFLVSLPVFYFMPDLKITPKTNLIIALLVFAALFVAWRLLTMHLFSRPFFRSRLLILGEAPEARELCDIMNASPHLGYSCLDIVSGIAPGQVLPPCDTIVVSHLLGRGQELTRALYDRFFAAVTVIGLPDFYEKIRRSVAASALSEQWVLNNLAKRDASIYDHLKRPLDAVLAVVLSVPALVFLPFIALAIWLEDRGPVFYRQDRVGFGGKVFRIFKFRTMRADAEAQGALFAAKDDPRVTRVGKFLRRTRLDELPQLWDILRGEMSFVGPRPERPEFEARISETLPLFPVRHLVRPGLTGWAQVNAPYAATADDHAKKLRLDLYYLKYRSFTLDMAVILKTIYRVFKLAGQ